MAILNLKFMWDTRVKKIQHEAIANVGPDIRSLGEDLGLEMWIQCWLHVSDSRGDEASRGNVKVWNVRPCEHREYSETPMPKDSVENGEHLK